MIYSEVSSTNNICPCFYQHRDHLVPDRSHGPLPQESSFFEAARESMPTGRLTTATRTSNLRGMGRGRGRTSAPVVHDGQQASMGRGKGRTSAPVVHDAQQANMGRGSGRTGAGTRRKRQVEQANSSGTTQFQEHGVRTGGVARTDYATGPGSLCYLLVGNDGQAAITDLNASILPNMNGQGEEVPLSQSAPHPDDV